MNWYEYAIAAGWPGPREKPRQLEHAVFPLETQRWYRVSYNPAKCHLLQPDQDHSWCGLTLAADPMVLMDTGYEDYYWIARDDDYKQRCKECTTSDEKHRTWLRHRKSEPKFDGPISKEEWKQIIGKPSEAQLRRMDAFAGWVQSILGGEIVEARRD